MQTPFEVWKILATLAPDPLRAARPVARVEDKIEPLMPLHRPAASSRFQHRGLRSLAITGRRCYGGGVSRFSRRWRQRYPARSSVGGDHA